MPVLDATTINNNPGSPGSGGNISVTGQVNLSQATTFSSFGVLGGGDINLNGTVNGNGNSDLTANAGTGNITTQDINNQGGNVTFTGSAINAGNINTGDSTTSAAGNVNLTATGGNLTVGNITTNADTDFPGDSQFPGAGNVTLSANLGSIMTDTISASASIGGFLSGNGGIVTINARDNIQTGVISSVSNAGRGSPISITSTNGNIITGNLNAGGISGAAVAGGGDITLTTNNGSITTQNINSRSYQVVGTPQNGGNIAITANGGNITTGNLITFIDPSPGSLGGNGGTITLTTDGNIETDSLNTSTPNGSGGNLLFNGNVILNSALTTITTTGSSSGGTVTYNGTVERTSPSSNSLTINTGNRNVTFSNSVGTTIPLENLTVNSSGTTAFNSTVDTASLTTNAGGSTQLNGDVTTTGSQTYNDPVTLTGDRILTANDINFNSLQGTGNLTLQPLTLSTTIGIGTGTGIFNDPVTLRSPFGGSIIQNGGSSFNISNDLLTLNVAGDISLNSNSNNFNTVAITQANNATLNDTTAINFGTSNLAMVWLFSDRMYQSILAVREVMLTLVIPSMALAIYRLILAPAILPLLEQLGILKYWGTFSPTVAGLLALIAQSMLQV